MKRLLPLLVAVAGCAGWNVPPKAVPGVSICMPCTSPCPNNVATCELGEEPPPPAPLAPAAAVAFEPGSGAYAGPQQVVLSSSTPNAVIHYTLDGSEPTTASPVYTGPITVDPPKTVKAIAVAPGMAQSPTATGAYTLAEAPAPAPAPPARVTVGEKKLELKDKVYFDTGKSSIKSESFSLLDEVAAVLNDHPEVKGIQVEGHTDNKGGVALNKKLSKARAEAVKAYLVKKGVAPERLTAKGFGPTRPIATNKTVQGREENRRVDFVIAP